MSHLADLPPWSRRTFENFRLDAEKVVDDFEKFDLIQPIGRKRLAYLKLVRDFLEVEGIAERFSFFIKVKGLDEVRQGLYEEGSALGISLDEIESITPKLWNVLIVDTETTGLGLEDEPITFAGVLVQSDQANGRICREISSYYGEREPSCEIKKSAERVHGIKMSCVRGKAFDLRQMVTLFGVADVVVAHNAKFDKRMLSFMDSEKHHWRCSYSDIDWPTSVSSRSLSALCDYFEVQRNSLHNAMSDVRALISVLQCRRQDGKNFLFDLLPAKKMGE